MHGLYYDLFDMSHIQCSDAILTMFVIYVTLLMGGIGFIHFVLTSEEKIWKMKYADPDECVEIPQKYLYFQKLASALHQSELPAWCKEEGVTRLDVFEDLVSWMKSELHPNFQDVSVLADILEPTDASEPDADSEPFKRILYEDACRWMTAALAIWTHTPDLRMPCWSGHSFVHWEADAEEDQTLRCDAEAKPEDTV